MVMFPEASVLPYSLAACLLMSALTGSAGDWQDDGACTTVALKAGAYITAHYESKSVPLSLPVKTPAGAGPKSKNSRFFRS